MYPRTSFDRSWSKLLQVIMVANMQTQTDKQTDRQTETYQEHYNTLRRRFASAHCEHNIRKLYLNYHKTAVDWHNNIDCKSFEMLAFVAHNETENLNQNRKLFRKLEKTEQIMNGMKDREVLIYLQTEIKTLFLLSFLIRTATTVVGGHSTVCPRWLQFHIQSSVSSVAAARRRWCIKTDITARLSTAPDNRAHLSHGSLQARRQWFVLSLGWVILYQSH